MQRLSDFPKVLFFVSCAVLWLSTKIGASLHKWWGWREHGEGEDFNVVLTATLTLLGLIMGLVFLWQSADTTSGRMMRRSKLM
jgi:hypothetical protein